MSDLYKVITEDIPRGIIRIRNDKSILDQFSKEDLLSLSGKLDDVRYDSDEDRRARNVVKNMIFNKLKIISDNQNVQGSLIQPPSRMEILAAGQSVIRQTAVLELHIKGKGFNKSVNSEQFLAKHGNAGDVNPHFVRISLETIDRDYLIDLHNLTAKFKDWLKSKCVPSRVLAPGFYLVPLSLLNEVDRRLIEFVEQRNTLLDVFESHYETIKEEAKDNLGINYSEDYYPTFATLREHYVVESQYISFNVEAAIQSVNQQIYERELQKQQIKWADTFDEVREALRTGFRDLVGLFAEKLGRNESTGKHMIFHKKRMDDLKDFLSTFEARNLSADVELSKLAVAARKILDGTDADTIRSDENIRDALATQFTAIKAAADGLIVIKNRQFNLEE